MQPHLRQRHPGPVAVAAALHGRQPRAPECATRGRTRTVRLYGLLVRLAGLTLTAPLVAAACEVALDLTAWQCAGTARAPRRTRGSASSPRTCPTTAGGADPAAASPWPPRCPRVSPACSGTSRTAPGARTSPSNPCPAGPSPPRRPAAPDSAGPASWYGCRLGRPAARRADRGGTPHRHRRRRRPRGPLRPGGRGTRRSGILGLLLYAVLVVGAVVVLWVVGRRGRSEHRLDQELDATLVRLLPLGSIVLFALTLLYAGWSRPGWHSTGRLPGDTTFGGLALAQGLLVITLGVVARVLYRTRPEPRTALRGLAGPAVAMLACALGGVMSGGVAQRVADWLDGTRGSLPGPPVLLTWQASVIPPTLLVLLGLCGRLALRTWRLRAVETRAVELDYLGEAKDTTRTRRIASTRAMAALTDRAPLMIRRDLVRDPAPRRRAGGRPDHRRRSGTGREGRTPSSEAQPKPRRRSGSWADRPRLHPSRHFGDAPTRTRRPAAPSASSGTSAPSGRAPPTPSHRPATPSVPCPT